MIFDGCDLKKNKKGAVQGGIIPAVLALIVIVVLVAIIYWFTNPASQQTSDIEARNNFDLCTTKTGTDTDGDGAPDWCDPCPKGINVGLQGGVSPDDKDGDGIPAPCDIDDTDPEKAKCAVKETEEGSFMVCKV